MIDLASNKIHLLHPDAFKMDPLERIELSNNSTMDSVIVTAARRGQEELIDYLRSSEYASHYKDTA